MTTVSVTLNKFTVQGFWVVAAAAGRVTEGAEEEQG